MLRERRASMEANSSRAYGPGVPLPEADESHRGGSGRASQGCRDACGIGCGGSGSLEGRKGHHSQGAKGTRGTTTAGANEKEKEGQEVGGESGAEDTSLRIPAGLQQVVEITLVRQARLCGLAS